MKTLQRDWPTGRQRDGDYLSANFLRPISHSRLNLAGFFFFFELLFLLLLQLSDCLAANLLQGGNNNNNFAHCLPKSS